MIYAVGEKIEKKSPMPIQTAALLPFVNSPILNSSGRCIVGLIVTVALAALSYFAFNSSSLNFDSSVPLVALPVIIVTVLSYVLIRSCCSARSVATSKLQKNSGFETPPSRSSGGAQKKTSVLTKYGTPQRSIEEIRKSVRDATSQIRRELCLNTQSRLEVVIAPLAVESAQVETQSSQVHTALADAASSDEGLLPWVITPIRSADYGVSADIFTPVIGAEPLVSAGAIVFQEMVMLLKKVRKSALVAQQAAHNVADGLAELTGNEAEVIEAAFITTLSKVVDDDLSVENISEQKMLDWVIYAKKIAPICLKRINQIVDFATEDVQTAAKVVAEDAPIAESSGVGRGKLLKDRAKQIESDWQVAVAAEDEAAHYNTAIQALKLWS